MPELVLGTAQLGSAYGINNSEGDLDEKSAFAVLDAAVSSGVLTLDTAEGYGKSEAMIGSYYKEHPSCGLRVCTKLTGTFDSDAPDAACELERRVEESARSLGGCPIIIYYLHAFSMCRDERLLGMLAALKREGLFGTLGVSVYEPGELRYVLDKCADQVGAVQIPLNMLNCAQWLSEGLLEEAASKEVSILARSVYIQGLVFKDPDDSLVSRLGLSEVIRSLADGAGAAGVSIARYSCDFVRGMRGVTHIILGCETPRQVAENACLFVEAPVWDEPQRRKQIAMSSGVSPNAVDPRCWQKQEPE